MKKTLKVNEIEKNQIIMIDMKYPNGNQNRTIGIINTIEASKNSLDLIHITMLPVNSNIAKEIREEYLTEEYNYQGHKNCYCDSYGFSSQTLGKENQTVTMLGVSKIENKSHKIWNPAPGNTGYDLMC